jgi:hypothetical protein
VRQGERELAGRPLRVDLARIQQLISQLVREPEGVAAALRKDPNGALARALADTVCGNERLGAADRLEVYANAYFFRIHDALKEMYPALAAAIGDDWFNDLCGLYLLDFPSRFPNLADAGGRLARFLSEQRRAAPLRERFPWATDLARLEWAIQVAFDAPDARPLRGEDVARIPPEDWGDLGLSLHPTVELLELAWPVCALRRACDREEPVVAPKDAALEHVLVWRLDERVSYRVLDDLEASALATVARGARFGEILEHAAERLDDDAAPLQGAEWLRRWVTDQVVRGGGGNS